MFQARLLAFLCLVGVIGPIASLRAEGPSDAVVDAYLKSCETGYSREHQMLGVPFQSPGYHSQVAQGTWVHPTRQSLNYAVMLVCRGTSNDLDRAEKIIRKVLSLQVTDPEHKYHGIWPWLMEEPVDQMAPPDRNWADFLGAQLALLLKQYTDRLPDPKSVNHRGECCVTAKFLSLTNPVCRSHE